ncbi:SPFH domain-containing protein [Undibacterium sp. TS12]|uniref:SPFH domain-containing protein n=1 Tax=Undibacterium sp. TS12 TaxID=2908202 RepID=UPI001F4C6E30|nr:SPFH domain-containing protein [Undibacterium sp. TS12]MCH8622493.1 hypothetical protein [Undibacterium sp. TS12]
MKKLISISIMCLTAGLAACGKQDIVEIKPNETAFLIQLDGNSKTQKAFMSEEYLAENKVASKRVVIPYVSVAGANFFAATVPAAKLIMVDRKPVTREWTRSEKTGTSPHNQAISVESKESIDFSIGVVLTASIPENSAAKFLYHYAGTPLEVIADTNIRGYVQAALSREFGARDLDTARKEKALIFTQVFKETRDAFEKKGVSIDNLGYSEGMTYSDANIQKSINETFEAQMAVQKAQQRVVEAVQLRLAAEEFAKAKDASVAKIDLDIRQLQAQAQLEAVRKWDGHLPANVVPQGSGMLFGLDKMTAK